jgi:hypothetical protein
MRTYEARQLPETEKIHAGIAAPRAGSRLSGSPAAVEVR